MPRGAREKSESGVYHIILRSQNRQTVFEDDEDREVFITKLADSAKKSGCMVHAYCLMENHIHLLLRETGEETSVLMRRLGAGFVYWYNRKHRRCGHLFQDRYRSEAVDSDEYFTVVLRFIHNNPVKAGLVSDPKEYPYSSCNDYLGRGGVTDVEFALGLFGENSEQATGEFIRFHGEQADDRCLEDEERHIPTDREARMVLRIKYGFRNAEDVKALGREEQRLLLGELKRDGYSTRQIERITGVGRHIILQA